jgi:hypothetical protein
MVLGIKAMMAENQHAEPTQTGGILKSNGFNKISAGAAPG